MSEAIASQLLTLVGLYLLIGMVFALAFVFRGAGRIDPAAQHGTWGFRILIVPGCAVFWPLLIGRWLAAARAQK